MSRPDDTNEPVARGAANVPDDQTVKTLQDCLRGMKEVGASVSATGERFAVIERRLDALDGGEPRGDGTPWTPETREDESDALDAAKIRESGGETGGRP